MCTDALGVFAVNFLPRISRPFVLVSGDSDRPVDDGILSHPEVIKILKSDLLLGWHAQNLAAEHPKLFPMPIGLDYHTMWNRPGMWGIAPIAPIAQEHLMLSVLGSAPYLAHRYLGAYCNWQFALDRGDRQDCFVRVDKAACYFEEAAMPRNSTWRRQAEFMYVLSPEGAGMDCHRTWEALILGCIPIVKRSPLARLFDTLPVLVVDDWSEINKDRLFEFFKTSLETQYDFSPLFLDYWKRRIKGEAVELLKPMTRMEFNSYLTRAE